MKTFINPRLNIDEESLVDVLNTSEGLNEKLKLFAAGYVTALVERQKIEKLIEQDTDQPDSRTA